MIERKKNWYKTWSGMRIEVIDEKSKNQGIVGNW